MENTIFKNLLIEIKNGIEANKKLLDKEIQKDMSKVEFISIDKIIELVSSY